MTLHRHYLFQIFCLSWIVAFASASDCQTATVGSPYSTCFDIYTNAGLTEAQFDSYNPGLDCSLLQIGQLVCISPGTLPSNAPSPSANGTCYEYWPVSGDTCSSIASEFTITVTDIENWNVNTFEWKGCSLLQVGFPICVSTGDPPPIQTIPGLECGPQSEGNATCPLNACCSAFGFCGLTDEFCSTTGPNPCISNCGQPTLQICSSPLTRKLGYYAGWGDRRSCGTNVAPDELDLSGYTHVTFAFATFSQSLTIDIQDADVPLLQQLVNRKSDNPSLQVLLAVGGWDFSEDNTTEDLFSIMIGSSANRATFISSVVDCLSQYNLDGIDIDFEYPGAIERNAPPGDTPNLTAFFMELRQALGSKLISCAAPAGYWFLKGFEIDAIATYVDFINMMSYDYHGPWDVNVTGQAPVTNPQTSILDINTSTLLYTRAGVDLQKVNLGLAWYGRTYQVADPSCTGYNCTMVGGGEPGPCTLTSGILAQFEINNLLATGISPTLDMDSQTYWFNNGDSLITFDQQDTWNVKQEYAQEHCFGGTFIWSEDQSITDLENGDGSAGEPPGGEFTAITWNPNPYPSPGAESETFAQSAGVVQSSFTTVVGAVTQTLTSTLTFPAFTSTTTSWMSVTDSDGPTVTSTIGISVVPASTTTITRTVTAGTTITTSTPVTNSATTIVIPVPTTDTSITIGGIVLTLTDGGTVINSPIPTWVTISSAITPTWTANILPPSAAPTVTFTAPLTSTPTWSSIVPVPPSSSSSGVVVTGPPSSSQTSRCNVLVDIWDLLPGPKIDGCMPLDVGIFGGITPTAIPPPGWIGPWTDPAPLPTDPTPDGEPSDTSSMSSTSSTSTTSSSTCAPTPTIYDLPSLDDSTSSSVDMRKRTLNTGNATQLYRRAGARHIAVNRCGVQVTNGVVSLGMGAYVRLPRLSTTLSLASVMVPGRPGQGSQTPQEHIFELNFINQFFTDSVMGATSCAWVEDILLQAIRVDGSGTNFGISLLSAIDNQANMVWVDLPMNQAKSSVVGNNNLNSPPGAPDIEIIGDFDTDEDLIYNVEWFIRNLGALGEYFEITANTFQATALKVQNLLSELTPTVVPSQTASIPLIFNQWLSDLISQYPSRCTSRANSAWNLYRNQMQAVASISNPPTVPTCFSLYTANAYNPSTFVAARLIPPAPTSAQCNVPGTPGTVSFATQSGPITPIPDLPQMILGSGNTDYYAVGSGSNLSESHYQGVDINTVLQPPNPNCAGVWGLVDAVPGQANFQTANIAFNCNGGTGQMNAPFNFVINGQPLQCATQTVGHAGGTTVTIYCAVSQAAALACAGPSGLASQMWFVV